MVGDFVLDASVTAAWRFHDEASDASNALRRSLAHNTAVVPRLWHLESANMLLIAERRRRISPARCTELLDFLSALPIRTEDEYRRAHNPVLHLARKHRLTIYDAVYLDLALQQTLPLATRDNDLQRTAKSAGVELLRT